MSKFVSAEELQDAIELAVNIGKDMILCNYVHKGYVVREEGMFFTAAFNEVVMPILVELEAKKKLIEVLEEENEELLEKFFPIKINENKEGIENG